MLQKESWLFVTDNTNVRWIRIFQLYKGFFRKSTKEGLFVKGSSRVVEPPRIEYKGFKYKYKVKGDLCRLWVCRTRCKRVLGDHKVILLRDNSGVNINKKVNIMSKYISGVIVRSQHQKKLLSLFKKSI